MRFTFRTLTDPDVEALLGWHYEPPYDAYDPERDDVEELRAAVGSPNWFGVDEASGDLAAFLVCRVGEHEVEAGFGLRPDLTGRGLGAGFVEAVVELIRARWETGSVVLEVLPWNERAMRAYEAAGFVRGPEHDKTFPEGTTVRFVAMRRALTPPTP
jgi:ribosomal-protein-alanine N-acetyltransferase